MEAGLSEMIDFHTHNFPDDLAPRAVAAMEARLVESIQPAGDGTIAAQIAHMDAAGVAKGVVCPVATRPSQFHAILDRAKAVRDGACGEDAAARLVQLGSVHPEDGLAAEHIREIASAGLKGVKMHPYYQDFRLDDPAHFPFFSAMRDAGLFAMVHCGFDPGFPGAPMLCGPRQIADLLRAVPGLVFVAAHLGGCGGNPPHAVDELLEFPQCYLDTAVIHVCDGDEECRRVMAEWPAERLLFGTDYFWRDERIVADWVRRLRPDPCDLERIFSANARGLLGIADRR